jgi:hypothetical protein
MAFAEKVGALPLPGLRRRVGGRRGRPERPQPLVGPLEARQVREAAALQRELGVGRLPGMTHEEFEGRLLQRIRFLC